MREIKFRGKRVDNGEWVYGYPIIVSYKAWIKDINDTTTNPRRLGQNSADFRCVEVEKETVGQYTGLKDKNGVEIYEGDIVTACWYDYEEPNHDMTGIVEFTEGWMSYWIADYDKKEFSELNGQGYYHWTIEVIGNIYDNPELVEGEV